VNKILLLVPDLEYGSVATQVSLLATGLPRSQFEVRVAVLGRSGPLAEPLTAAGIPVDVLGWHRLLELNPLRRLRQLVNEYRPEIIHAWRWPALRALSLAAVPRESRLAFTPGRRSRKPNLVQRFFDQRLLRRVNRLLATSPGEAEDARRRGLSDERITRVTPGVAMPSLSAAKPLLLRDVLQLPDSARFLICAGPLEPHKGFQDAIWAFDILKYLFETLHLVLLGTGSDRLRLEQFVRAIKATGNIHFLGSQADVPSALAQAEVVWVPSRVESGIQVALEAMAVGRPVVASQLPGLAELVVEGETGFLVPPRDKVALARQTRLLLDDAALRQRLGDAGRRRAESLFTAAGWAERVGEVYQ
jgi:glycosyltransferase involved in cell wall biosynthesis